MKIVQNNFILICKLGISKLVNLHRFVDSWFSLTISFTMRHHAWLYGNKTYVRAENNIFALEISDKVYIFTQICKLAVCKWDIIAYIMQNNNCDIPTN